MSMRVSLVSVVSPNYKSKACLKPSVTSFGSTDVPKKKTPTGVKVLIGSIFAAATGLGIYFLTRGKAKNKILPFGEKELKETIDTIVKNDGASVAGFDNVNLFNLKILSKPAQEQFEKEFSLTTNDLFLSFCKGNEVMTTRLLKGFEPQDKIAQALETGKLYVLKMNK